MCPANCQPTIRRLWASRMKAKNTTPSQQRRYVMSPTQSLFGASAVKSRSTRSGRRRAKGSGVVVRHPLEPPAGRFELARDAARESAGLCRARIVVGTDDQFGPGVGGVDIDRGELPD